MLVGRNGKIAEYRVGVAIKKGILRDNGPRVA